MKIAIKDVAGGARFRCVFRHPVSKQIVSHGLGSDRLRAESDCREAVEIFSSPSLVADSASPRLMAYSVKAYEMVFGFAPAWASAPGMQELASIDDGDAARLAAAICDLAGRRDLLERIAAMLTRIESRRYLDLFAKFTAFETELKVLRGRLVDSERELSNLRRARNAGVDETIGTAFEIWEKEYKQHHARVTWRDAKRCVELFVKSLELGGKFPLADVRAAMIDTWRASLTTERKNAAGEIETVSLSAKSKKRMLANVRLFFAWAQDRYDLAENPGRRVKRAAGDRRHAEDIRAVTRLEDLKEICRRLQHEPYWRAVVSLFIFAGPRYGEFVKMKISDVHLDEGHIRIFAVKTGKPRSVPIERTTLLPTLRKYLKYRAGPAPDESMKRDWQTDILFPSIVGANQQGVRTVSAPGVWCGNGVFGAAWKAQYQALFDATSAYFDFGPSEWRHTFGTILAHCKWSALQISEVMGNSEDIVKDYYVVPGSGGRVWPFKY